MKRSFTLMELLISIILFSIILVFLYEVLDSSKIHNEKYEKLINNKIDKYDIEYIVLHDFLNKENNVSIFDDKNNNSIVTFQSSNTYHNPFSNYITYFLVEEKENFELLRVESSIKFDREKINEILENKETYIDSVKNNIKKFRIEPEKEKKYYILYLEYLDGTSLFFPIKN